MSVKRLVLSYRQTNQHPDINDVLPRECAAKKEIEETIRVVFSTFGYKETESPSFEYDPIGHGEQMLNAEFRIVPAGHS